MPLHGLGVCRHSQHRPGLPMRQSWCSDGQYQCPGCLWPSPALCPGCWPQACTQARPHSAQRTWQPSNTVTVSTAGRLQPGIGAGYRNNWQDILSYTCPQVTLTLSPVPLIFPAAHNRGSYWVRPYSNCYATPEYAHYAHPVASCGYAVISAVSGVRSTHPARCGFVDISSIPGVHPPRPPTPLAAVVTSLIPGECSSCTPFYQLWLRGFSPIPGVCTPHPASCGYVAISPIPGVRPPRPPLCLCQLWLRGYLTDPWNTHTTPSQVWLCGYLAISPIPGVRPPLCLCLLWLSHLSLEYAHHAQPGVAMWLSHPSMEYAHQAHLCANCGYVAISHIPGVHTPRPARCGHVAISPIPGVRPPRPPLYPCQLWPCGYLTYPWSTHTTPSQVWLCGYLTHPWSTPTTPTSLHLPAVATWLSHLSRDHAHHAHPSTSCGYVVSHQSPEYAHHTQPGVPISPIPGVRPPRPPSASCGHVAISLIPGACPPRLPFYPLWLCGFATNPWSKSNAPSHLPGVATRLSPLPLEYARPAHPLSAAATQLSHISLKYTHPNASCGYTTSHLALEYTHHAQPAAGVVAMWPSHFSSAGIQRLATLPPEYALHTQPFHQLWLPYPIPPPFPNPGVQRSPSPHAQPLRQLRYVAFSLLSRMSITRSTPTMPKLIHQLWLHNHLPYFPQDMPITPMQLTR